MKLFLDVLLVLTSLGLMALILLHRGKGGGLSSLFGGTMQSSLSGSSVVEKNLDRLTLFTAAVWAISIIGVGLLLKVGA
jgi:preprotein translocase subunit SecG